MTPVVEPLRHAALDLAWSLWAECGVSSWSERRHADWTIELEPLLVLTAFLGPYDPRLLREAIDWCVRNERFVSLKQFRHVVTAERWPFKGDIASFGATAGRLSGKRWPGVTDEAGVAISLSGKSQAPDLRRPALLQLKLRALLGVSARAEIVRVLLTRSTEWSVKQISERVAYTRRQVSFDLDMLVAGGLVHRSLWTKPATYTLADPAAVARLTGAAPPHAPRWAPILRVLTGLFEAFEALATMAAPGPELLRRLRQLEPAGERAGLSIPAPHEGHDYVEAVLRWSTETFASLARGAPSALRAERVMTTAFPAGREQAGR